MPTDRLLVVIDPTTEAQPALARATWLGKRMGAALELFICAYDQYLAGTRFFDSAGLERLRDKLIEDSVATLESLAEEARKSDLTVTVDARWDHPLDQGIVRKVLEANPALVIKDTHFHPALKRTIFSNTDWNLIRTCPVPLLLVKPRGLAEPPTLIAAVDPVHRHDKPADLDRAIMKAALLINSAVDGQLHVFHAFDPAPAISAAAYGVPPMGIDVNEIVEEVKQRHREALDDLLESYSVPADHIQLKQGRPDRALPAAVEALAADLVVMGSVSRSALDRMLLGSTAEKILNELPCDLLLVKPPGLAGLEP